MLLISSVTLCEELFRCISHETILFNIFYEIENLITFYFSHQILTDSDAYAETCRIGVSKYLNGYRKSIACKENMYFHHWQAHALCSLKKDNAWMLRMKTLLELMWYQKPLESYQHWSCLLIFFMSLDRYAIL